MTLTDFDLYLPIANWQRLGGLSKSHLSLSYESPCTKMSNFSWFVVVISSFSSSSGTVSVLSLHRWKLIRKQPMDCCALMKSVFLAEFTFDIPMVAMGKSTTWKRLAPD